MRRKKILSLPTLKSRKGDLNKLWYVEIGMRNPKSGEYERKRYYSLSEKDFSVAINEKNSVEERYIEGQKIIEYLTEKLKRGWTIFDEPEEVKFFCEKSLIQYSHEATIYQKKLSNNRTYEFLVSSYLKENLSNWDKSTCDTYTGRYRRFGLWLQENELHKIDIAEITNQMIVDFFNFQKNEKDLTSKTYYAYAGLLKEFFDNLVEKGFIQKSPVHSIPKNTRKKDMGSERIQQENLVKLMQHLDKVDVQMSIVCCFEYYCGMRPGQEIRFLKIRDIDFRKDYSKVRVSMDNAKTSLRREVILPDVFRDYLIQKGIDKYPSDYYVIGQKGKPSPVHVSKNYLGRKFTKYRDELGLPEENTLYSMKHTGGVALAEAGEPIINIRDHFGHTSIDTTEKYLKRHGFQSSKTIRQMGTIYEKV